MGKGKVWSQEECTHLAEAWIHATEEVSEPSLKGTGQDSTEFWMKVLLKFKELGPTNSPTGTYCSRGSKPIISHWKENIARDCKKFNKALSDVRKFGFNNDNFNILT